MGRIEGWCQRFDANYSFNREWIAQKLNYENMSQMPLIQNLISILSMVFTVFTDRFDDTNLLVIAGYNAGPGITDKWLETLDISDIDVFVEIFHMKTREHIKRL